MNLFNHQTDGAWCIIGATLHSESMGRPVPTTMKSLIKKEVLSLVLNTDTVSDTWTRRRSGFLRPGA